MRHTITVSFFLALWIGVDGVAQTDEEFFDDSTVQEIRITMEPAAWQSLRENYLLNTYHAGDFSWKDTFIRNIGIRSRGGGSRSPEKPNLLVSFDKFVPKQRFMGFATVTLKANNQDASMICEALSMALMRRMRIPAPREAYARLFVNDEFFGLYTIVEAVDKHFLSRVYGESDGYLYEFSGQGQYHFDYLGEDVSQYPYFEPKTHEDRPDMATLIEMIRAVNIVSDDEFRSVASGYLNVQGFMTLIAVQNYVSDNDGVLSKTYGMNNFYLYRREDSNVFEFIPWDADLTFSWFTRPVLEGIAENVLARRAFDVPQWRQAYLDALEAAAMIAGENDGWLEHEIRRQYTLISEYARQDPHKQCLTDNGIQPCGAPEFENKIGELLQFAATRTPYVLEEVARLRCHRPVSEMARDALKNDRSWFWRSTGRFGSCDR